MSNPVDQSTSKVEQSFFPVSITPTSRSFPIAYADDIWDIAKEFTALSELTGEEGQYTQHYINELLANRINSALSALSQGAVYLGAATPSSPEHPETSVNGFYLALTSGTYTNFTDKGGAALSVLTGEIALFIVDDDAWKKTHIFTKPYIDPSSKNWIVDGEDTGIKAEGQDGQQAYQPFKGTFPTQSALEAAYPSPNDGDTAYVENTVDGQDVLEVWDVVDGEWHNTQRTDDAPVFGTGQMLASTGIDDLCVNDDEGNVGSSGAVSKINKYLDFYKDVDFSQLSKQKGGINGTTLLWQDVAGSTRHYSIPLANIKTVKIEGYNQYIAWLTNNTEPTTSGTSAPLVENTSRQTIHGTAKLDVPIGAQYLFVLANSSNGSDIAPQRVVLVSTEESLPKLAKEQELEDTNQAISNIVYGKETQLTVSDTPCGYIITESNSQIKWVNDGTAKGAIIQIPIGNNYLEFTAGNNGGNVLCLLESATPVANAEPDFATGFEKRITVGKGSTLKLKLNSSCRYLYYNIMTAKGVSVVPASIACGVSMTNETVQDKKKLNLLVIGSSGDMEIMAYVPPILNEIESGYDITIGIAYHSGAQASYYVDAYKNNTQAAEYYMEWLPNSSKWTKVTSSSQLMLNAILLRRKWNIVMLKGTVSSCRELVRIIQSVVVQPVSVVTSLNYAKSTYDTFEVDANGDPLEDTAYIFENDNVPLRSAAVKKCACFDLFPVGTAIQNARTNPLLRQYGDVYPYEQTFTVEAGGEIVVSNGKIKGSGSKADKIRVWLTAGKGPVRMLYGSNYGSSITFSSTPTTYSAEANSDNFKIVNSGSDSCTVTVRLYASYDNYLLSADNTHLQSGIALLMCSYVVALKLLEWTGNRHLGIGASRFVPTDDTAIAIGAIRNTSDYYSGNMIHGEAMGVSDFIGTDDNVYSKSELTKVGDNYYVTSTLEDGAVTENSIQVNEVANWKNIYAAQEIANIAVGTPLEITDCGTSNEVLIDIPVPVPN